MAILGISMAGQPDPSMPTGYHRHLFPLNTDTMKSLTEATVALHHMVAMKVRKGENMIAERRGIE